MLLCAIFAQLTTHIFNLSSLMIVIILKVG